MFWYFMIVLWILIGIVNFLSIIVNYKRFKEEQIRKMKKKRY